MKIRTDRLRRAAARLGLPGAAALVLTGAAAWMHAEMVPAADRAAAALRRLAAAPAAPAPASRPLPATPGQLVARAVGALPADDTSNAIFAAVLARAREHGLQVEAVQFQTEASRLAGVRRHRMELPLHGSYAGLRAWISDALRDQPALTLDVLEIARKDLEAPGLDARASLSLWTGDAGAGAATAAEEDHGR